jgi:hypothetical protein
LDTSSKDEAKYAEDFNRLMAGLMERMRRLDFCFSSEEKKRLGKAYYLANRGLISALNTPEAHEHDLQEPARIGFDDVAAGLLLNLQLASLTSPKLSGLADTIAGLKSMIRS